MILQKVARQAERFAADNSPAILTGIGVIGTIAGAYLAARGAFKSAEIIDLEDFKRGSEKKPPLTTGEKVKLTWFHYLPAAGTVALSVGCIVCSNQIGTRRAAAMAAAYSLSDKAFTEYKEKVMEKLGVNKEQAARDELAQERVTKNPPPHPQVIIAGQGEVLCFDQPAGRYFKSDMEKLRRTVNDLNQETIVNGFSTLRDFYALLKLPAVPYADELGWTTDNLLEVQYSAVLTDDSQPCIAIDYKPHPLRGYK